MKTSFCRIKIKLAFPPSLSCGLYVAAVLFGRAKHFNCALALRLLLRLPCSFSALSMDLVPSEALRGRSDHE